MTGCHTGAVTGFAIIGVKKTVTDPAVILISQDCIHADVLHAAENVPFDGRGCFLQLGDQPFGLQPLGSGSSVAVHRACVCKVTGTADKLQSIDIPPCLDIVFADQIQRANQLHSFKVGAVELWHHGLCLTAVQNAHQCCFYYIVIMVAESNLIAAEILCLAVKIAPAHSGTDVAGRLGNVVYRVKDPGAEHGERDSEKFGVSLNHPKSCFAVAGVHAQIDHLERDLVSSLQFLKKHCHQHRILAAGDAHGNFVVRPDQVIVNDRFYKSPHKIALESFPEAFFNFCTALLVGRFRVHGADEPASVAALQLIGIVAFFQKFFCRGLA